MLTSPNAMSVFTYEPKPTELPESVYLRFCDEGHYFLGAARIEQNHTGVGVLVHVMLLERNRAKFHELCELAVIWCLHKRIEPFTRVLTTPHYDYMHKFMQSVQGVATDGEGCKVYSLPVNWKPTSITTCIVEF